MLRLSRCVRDDEDFAQGKGDALPELVGRGDGRAPPGVVQRGAGIGGAGEARGLRLHVGQEMGRGEGLLAVDPRAVSTGLDGGEVGRGRAVGGLIEEAGRPGVGGAVVGVAGVGDRRGRGLRTVDAREETPDFPGRDSSPCGR